MRIAFISSLNGGVGTFTINLSKALSEHVEGLDLYVWQDPNRSISVPKLPENVKIKIIENNPILFFLKIFYHIPNLRNYDLIHFTQASFSLPIFIASKLFGIPCVFTYNGYIEENLWKYLLTFKFKFGTFVEEISRVFGIKMATKYIVVSNYVREKSEKRYKRKCKVIYYGVDIKDLYQNVRNRIRERLQIKNEENLILFISILYKFKDPITLVNAIPRVVKICNNVKFLIIGGGEMYDEILYRIKELRMEKYVITMKFVEDVGEYYSAADIFVMPSPRESFGLVCLEAMAYGLPVIAANGGAAPEVVGDAGLLFEPKNSEDLANKIIELINNKKLYKKLKGKGLKRVKQFTWDRAAMKYYELYKKTLEMKDSATKYTKAKL